MIKERLQNASGSSVKLEQHVIDIEDDSDCNCPMLSGILFNFSQLFKSNVTRDFKFPNPGGSSSRLLHEDKFNNFNDESFSKFLGSTCRSVQLSKLSSCRDFNAPKSSVNCSKLEQ